MDNRKKTKVTVIGIFTSLLLWSTASSGFTLAELDLRAYAGADMQRVQLEFEHNYGDNLFKGKPNQGNYWAALQFNRFVGLGIGYENGTSGTQTVILGDGDSYLGIPLLGDNGFEEHETSRKLSGTHLELIGYYPICPRFKLDLYGTIGGISQRLSLTDNFVGLNGIRAPEPIVRSYSEHKTVARVSVGLQQIMGNYFGARVYIAWQDTAEFQGLKPIERPDASTNVNLKACYSYGIGVFLTV